MEKSPFTGLTRKAALATYAVGILGISIHIAQSLLSTLVLNPIGEAILEAISTGNLDTTLTLITQFIQVFSTIFYRGSFLYRQ